VSEVIVPLAEVFVSPEEAEELGWQDRALCAQTDPEAFFPEKGGSTREAKRVCRGCEVRAECLDYALENDERFQEPPLCMVGPVVSAGGLLLTSSARSCRAGSRTRVAAQIVAQSAAPAHATRQDPCQRTPRRCRTS